jgi:hypothetical protein
LRLYYHIISMHCTTIIIIFVIVLPYNLHALYYHNNHFCDCTTILISSDMTIINHLLPVHWNIREAEPNSLMSSFGHHRTRLCFNHTALVADTYSTHCKLSNPTSKPSETKIHTRFWYRNQDPKLRVFNFNSKMTQTWHGDHSNPDPGPGTIELYLWSIVAERLECQTLNQRVVGSNPGEGTAWYLWAGYLKIHSSW